VVAAGAPLWIGERCEEGYGGLLCSRCTAGYTQWGANECRKCRSGGAVVVLAILVVFAVLVLSIGLVLNALRKGAAAAEAMGQEIGETSSNPVSGMPLL